MLTGDAVSRILLCLTVMAAANAVPGTSQTTPMVVNDLFSLEQLGTVSASPDGELLAVVVARARTSAETYRDFPFAGDVDHSDIWLVHRRSGERRNLTNGITDGSGYWNPVWSPNGERLALLSTKGGDAVRPYVWDRADSTVRRLTDRAADLQAYGAGAYPHYAMIWVDNGTLLCAVLPAGSTQSYFGMTSIMSSVRSHQKAMQEWEKVAKGTEVSVSVLESGREIPPAERPKGELLSIDVSTGIARVVASGNFRHLLVSPTGRHVALIAETGRVPAGSVERIPGEHQQWDLWRTSLAILPLKDRNATAAWIADVTDPRLTLIDDPPFHSWSPDGTTFAAIGKSDSTDKVAATLYIISARSGRVRRVADRQLEASATTWTRAGQLMALARGRQPRGSVADRQDWWLVEANDGEARRITRDFEVVPHLLLRTDDEHTMLGLAAGDLWSIDISGGAPSNLTDNLATQLDAVVWPSLSRRRLGVQDELILHASTGALYTLKRSGADVGMRPLPSPSKGAAIAEFLPAHRAAVFVATGLDGTFLWSGSTTDSHFVKLLALNEHVRQIADVERLLIDYEGMDGDSLKALLVLPPGHEKGKRLPLVTWVYGGFVVTDTTHHLVDKQLVSALNLTLLPSYGYAVLIPSLPLSSLGEASEPFLELPKGLMGAVNRVIELGFADPTKLAIMGHSYGGYSTSAIVSYTSRFQAAISLSGASHISSLYGTFSPMDRHAAYPHEPLFTPGLAESTQLRMGDTPWGDPAKYVFNSPLYFADRIQTPLMIIQGDMDYVPIQQGEELFTALYRLGRKAQFVRYWGEPHELSSPANIRDMWRRVFDWLDEHLGRSATRAPPAATMKH